MVLSEEKSRLLAALVAALRDVPGLCAIALGGSQARGTALPDSDLDLGLYYREASPFAIEEIRRIARQFSRGDEPVVTDFYEWGPFVNGGAWIAHPICKIDFLYRNLDQLEGAILTAQHGKWQHSFDQQPPFGFRSVTTLGEIHVCKPLHDPGDVLGPLKRDVAIFPPALKAKIIQDTLWCAEFTFRFARDFAKSGDVPNTVACMTRIFHYLVHALFALNDTYFMNDKRVAAEIEAFARKPADFRGCLSSILAAPGGDDTSLVASVEALQSVFEETAEIAGDLYRPRF